MVYLDLHDIKDSINQESKMNSIVLTIVLFMSFWLQDVI